MQRLLTGLGSILLFAACGGSDGAGDDGDTAATADESESGTESEPETETGDVSTADARTFRGELEDGSTLTVRLDVDASDPAVAPFVAFRAEAGAADPVVWIVGSLDAPADYDDALGPPTGRFLTFLPDGADLIADDGSNPTSSFACSELDDWFGTPTGDEADALNERYMEILNSSCDGQTAQVIGQPGATTDYVMVVDGAELPDFAEIYAGLLTQLEPIG